MSDTTAQLANGQHVEIPHDGRAWEVIADMAQNTWTDYDPDTLEGFPMVATDWPEGTGDKWTAPEGTWTVERHRSDSPSKPFASGTWSRATEAFEAL